MTGFLTMTRGSSFLKDSIAAWRESSGSKTLLVWAMFRGRLSLGIFPSVILEPPRTHDHVQQIDHQNQRDQTENHVPQNAHLSSSTPPDRAGRHPATLYSLPMR